MCGRYNIIPDADAWVAAFELSGDDKTTVEDISPSYNVAPSQDVPIVRMNRDNQAREIVLVHWGLIPFWANDQKIGYKMINARAETVTGKPAFRNAYLKRRCLIPANGFYEWQQQSVGKQPFLIQMKDQAVFAFAGLYHNCCHQYTNPAF